MEWQSTWGDLFQQCLKPFGVLIGDRKTWDVFNETVKGIIASGSVIGQRIASAYLTKQDMANWKDGFGMFAPPGSPVPALLAFLLPHLQL